MPIASPKKVTKKPVAATPIPSKKGHGAAWHNVAWLAVLALVFSGSSMTLTAMAQTSTPAVCNQNSIAGIRCLLRQLSEKIDAVNRKADRIVQLLETPVQTAPTPATNTNTTQNFETTKTEPVTEGSITCKQTCEDTFNVCAKQAGGNVKAYATCKTTYETCFTNCGS
ncbi:hypothetical protein IT407_04545 [Candidatus Uhrbacteria bacterium]|nr:hypothetical protein [Candidatus Uhrbacteria bacterium]